MPIASIAVARDAIVSTFKTAWDAQTPPVPQLLFDDVRDEIPAATSPWARIQVRHNVSQQATLAGEVGNRRFRRFGIVTVQIFTPGDGGLTDSDKFTKVALDAFEGQNTGGDAIEFRNARINEIGEDGPWFQANVISEFTYDTVK